MPNGIHLYRPWAASVLCLVATIAAQTGCHGLPKVTCQVTQAAQVTQPGQVTVMGAVLSPQNVPILSGGLTLKEALDTAGGLSTQLVASAGGTAIQSRDSASEVQTVTISGSPTGGTYKIEATYNNATNTTSAIAHNASAKDVEDALRALSIFKDLKNTPTVTGSAGMSYDVKFGGDLANTPIPLMKISDMALVGMATPSVTIKETTLGQNADANMVVPNGSGIKPSDLVVALYRTLTTGPTITYFSIPYVQHYSAGQIALQDGDQVRVVLLATTSLAEQVFKNPDPAAKNSDSVTLTSSSLKAPQTLRLDAGATLRTLTSALSIPEATTQVLVLDRPPSQTNQQETYLIPFVYDSSVVPGGVDITKNVGLYPRNGDQINITDLESVPVVTVGLISNLVTKSALLDSLRSPVIQGPTSRLGRTLGILANGQIPRGPATPTLPNSLAIPGASPMRAGLQRHVNTGGNTNVLLTPANAVVAP